MIETRICRENIKRVCACCNKKIKKKEIYCHFDAIIDGYNNTRKFFAHSKCLIERLKYFENLCKKSLENIPDVKYNVERYTGGKR